MFEAIFIILIGFKAGYQIGHESGEIDGAIQAHTGDTVCVEVPQFNKPNEWQCVHGWQVEMAKQAENRDIIK